jgi:hypothetical protein
LAFFSKKSKNARKKTFLAFFFKQKAKMPKKHMFDLFLQKKSKRPKKAQKGPKMARPTRDHSFWSYSLTLPNSVALPYSTHVPIPIGEARQSLRKRCSPIS